MLEPAYFFSSLGTTIPWKAIQFLKKQWPFQKGRLDLSDALPRAELFLNIIVNFG